MDRVVTRTGDRDLAATARTDRDTPATTRTGDDTPATRSGGDAPTTGTVPNTGTDENETEPTTGTAPSGTDSGDEPPATGLPEGTTTDSDDDMPQVDAGFHVISYAAEGIFFCHEDNVDAATEGDGDWSVFKGDHGWRTCLNKQGSRCCWDGFSSPPDLAAGHASACAKALCGSAYDADFVLAIEEEPATETDRPDAEEVNQCAAEISLPQGFGTMPAALKTALTDTAHEDCLSCCDAEAGFDAAFGDACSAACDAAIVAPVHAAEDFGSDHCHAAASMTVMGALFTSKAMCTTCCRSGANRAVFPVDVVDSCIAACTQP